MPTYEYKCKSCGHEFEAIQRITAPPLLTCPKCKDGRVQRMVYPSAFILKGKGWYVTDYARKDGGGWEASRTKDEKSELSGTAGTEKKETKEVQETKETKESKESKETKGTKETKETKEATATREAPKDSASDSLKNASNS